METLGIRMERVCSNAMTLAKYLNDNYDNLSVNYPGLENSEFYNIATAVSVKAIELYHEQMKQA